ncbi:MAG: hypothetical protein GXP29_03710 [Planctomycetes bacterium]|nr:hypothetical protein [Planctomycetota bacterium]
MSENPNSVPNPDPIEAEIGDLLAEAEALTSELSGEIGEAESTADRESEFFASESNSEASVEQQVDEAEQALTAATEELGGEKPSLPSKALKLPPPKAITLPASTPGKAPTKEPTKKPAKKVALTLPSGPSTAKTQALVAAKTPEPAIETKAPPGPSRTEQCKKALSALGVRLEPVGRAACQVLDTLDRPFAKIQFSARIIMGWLSLILSVAAISLWLFAVK